MGSPPPPRLPRTRKGKEDEVESEVESEIESEGGLIDKNSSDREDGGVSLQDFKDKLTLSNQFLNNETDHDEDEGESEEGLELTAPVEIKAPSQLRIPQGSEWRFEVAFGNSVKVTLLNGTAELFATELALGFQCTFAPGTKAAIYTWHGCTLEVDGECQVDYTSEETTMVEQSNLHWALEQIRQEAEEVGKDGPRLLIVGPENAGKTTLAKILTGYATKMERQPLVVNLDPKEGLLSLPGSLTAAPFRSIIDIEVGWGSSPTSGPSPVPVKLPLVYFYGLENPEEDEGKMFKPIISRMALAATGRLAEDEETKISGIIIDTPGSISAGKGGYEIISHTVSEFSINIIVVLGSERLYSDMTKRFQGKPTNNNNNPGETVAVLKISKSGGCVDRDATYMKQVRQAQIREYFFGDALGKTVLSPHTQTIDFNAISIYKTVAGNKDPESAMLDALAPGGDVDDEGSAAQTAASEKKIFEKVQPTLSMQGCILAIVHAEANEADQESIRDASVMGFVYVAEVDEKRRKVRVLAPVGGRSMGGRAVVWGRWPEEVVDLVG